MSEMFVFFANCCGNLMKPDYLILPERNLNVIFISQSDLSSLLFQLSVSLLALLSG